jgi:hypothetical protein
MLLAVLAVASLGCPRFRPTLPMHARTGDVELSVGSIRFRPQEMVLVSQSTEPHALQRAWLTVPSRSPCEGGLEADALIVDEIASVGGELSPGRHQIAIRFREGAIDYTLDTVADLEIENGLCLRVPVLTQSVPLVAEKRPILVIANGLLGGPDLSGLEAVASLEVGAGAWLGDVLVNGQLGVGAGICVAAVCGKNSDGSLNDGLALPLALEARYPLGGVVVGKLTNAFYLGGRYTFEPVWLPTLAGERSFQVQALQGILGWGFGDALPGPILHLERAVPFELADPLGVAVAPGSSGSARFIGGVEIRYLFPL